MKFKVLQEDFSKCLNTALRFTSSKMQLPVLANILLKTEKGRLLVKATNLETSISMTIGAKIEREGEITIPAKVISEIISNLESGQIDIDVEKERLKIVSAGFRSVVSGMNSSDFPKITDTISEDSIEISSQDLADALKSTLFSVSGDETRPVLTGVLFVLKEEEIMLVGTDGFRLSRKKLNMKNIKKEIKLILPKNTINEVVRISAEEKSLKFSLNEKDNQVVFSFSNSVLASRVIDGEYPDFEKIIPKSSKIVVSCEKEEILRAVRLASIFAKDSANVVKFQIEKDSLEVIAESGKSGEESTNLEAKIEGSTEGKFTIAFNYRFLEEFLNLVKGDEVILKFTDPNSPAIFLDPKDPDFLHIIMPVRLQN